MELSKNAWKCFTSLFYHIYDKLSIKHLTKYKIPIILKLCVRTFEVGNEKTLTNAKGIGMFVHCNLKFRADEIQFLYDNEHFIKRKLKIGRCPVCNKLVARLIETRILDNFVSDVTYVKGKAEKVINALQDEVAYSSLDNIPAPKTLYGFRYGENKESINKKTGEVTVTQKACDFNGNKEVVKRFKKKTL